MNENYPTKSITIQVTENDIKALASVLVDTLDYYSTLSECKQEMHLLRLSTELSKKLTETFFNHNS